MSSWSKIVVLPRGISWLMTMSVVGIGWLFFRATSLSHAWNMIQSSWQAPAPAWTSSYMLAVAFGLMLVAIYDWIHSRISWERARAWPWVARVTIQGILLALIVARWGKEPPSFIYFQF
jgi:hypothetical protein